MSNKVDTGPPWFQITNVCPCNPTSNNPSGRGLSSCPFGVQTNIKKLMTEAKMPTSPKVKVPTGSLYQDAQYIPPQLNPRQNTRIGQQWRNPY